MEASGDGDSPGPVPLYCPTHASHRGMSQGGSWCGSTGCWGFLGYLPPHAGVAQDGTCTDPSLHVRHKAVQDPGPVKEAWSTKRCGESPGKGNRPSIVPYWAPGLCGTTGNMCFVQ